MKISLLLVILLFLNGCALMSERQCRDADWYSYGVSAGQRGANADSHFRYIEACGKYHIAVDTKAYSRGYNDGLKTYCTPSNADRVGSMGDKFRFELCPEEQKDKLAVVYYEQATNALEQKVSSANHENALLKHDIDSLQRKIERLERQLARTTRHQHAMRSQLEKIHQLIKNNANIDAGTKRKMESLLSKMDRP